MKLPEMGPRGDRYEPLAMLGEGAMGVVYRARDRQDGHVLALKTLRRRSPEDLFRLKREFRALSGIAHPNVVELYDLEVEGERAWFTMEWIDGSDLVSALRAPGPQGADRDEQLRRAFAELASGLRALHHHHTLHRDIKPANVLLSRDGRVVLLDFGLAAVLDEPASASRGWLVGTLAYMAPEIARGAPATPASDWYAVGVVLYEVLTGRLPFDPGRLAVRQPSQRPAHPRELDARAPPVLCDLAMDLLAFDPEARPDEDDIRRRLAASSQSRAESDAAAGTAALVGRDAELAWLRRAFDHSRGAAVSVRVEGRSGVGKSSLVAHFVGELARAGEALVLRSRCHPQESVRYAAVDGLVDDLSRYLVDLPAERLDSIVPRQRAALLQVFPVLGRVPFPPVPAHQSVAGADPAETRRRAFAALCELLGRLSERLPLVFWIDDVQWGDLDSAALLRALQEGDDAPPALTLLTYRVEDREESPLLEKLMADEARREPDRARSLALEPLAAPAARSLAETLLAGADARVREAAARLLEQAGGSPFLVGELVRCLADRARAGAQGTSLRELQMKDVVRDRIDRLAEAPRQLLEIVAISAGPLARSVALEAAGIAEQGRRVTAALRNDLLLRSSPLARGEGLEIYHDRIRESVLAEIPEERLPLLHRTLLQRLEVEPEAAPERLYHHALFAGETERAAGFARRAGDQAAATLAFRLAADHYARALEIGRFDAADTRAIRRARADALVNAGRCEEAAPLFLQAAEGAPSAEARELRRLSAEQYMVSGLAGEGLGVLRPLLQELGLRYPETPGGALGSTLLRLLQLRLRGIRYRDVSDEALPVRDRTRMDVCFSAARGFVMTDTVRAAYLPLVGLLLALGHGEPRRVGRHLAMVAGAVLAPFGGSLGRFRDQLLAESHAIAERTGDPYVAASVALAEGQIGILDGDWHRALGRSEAALDILRDHCQGVSWERNVAHAAELRALEELGRFDEGHSRALRMAAEAQDRGDRYGALVAALMLGVTWTAQGKTDAARRQLHDALERWPREPYLMQHFYALRVEVHADLCDGAVAAARRRLETAWPQVQRSGFLRVAAPRIDGLLLRARVAAHAAHAAPGDAEAARTLARCTRSLGREKRGDARAHAALLQLWAGDAGVTAAGREEVAAGAAAAGREEVAAGAAAAGREEVAAAFASAGMAWFAELARDPAAAGPRATAPGWLRAVAPRQGGATLAQSNSANAGSA